MCNCGPQGDVVTMTDGNRLDVFFTHANRGKRMVYGAKTHEKLGYIGYGTFIGNVHESDVAARSNEFICGVCQKPFTVVRETAYCLADFPPASTPQPRLGDLKPRLAQERITASNRIQQEPERHPNFQGQPLDPWQDQGYNPNAGFTQQAQQAPQQIPQPPPQPEQPPQPAFNPAPPEPLPPLSPSSTMDNPTSAVEAARQQKEQTLGIPIIEPGAIGPPPNLSVSPPTSLAKEEPVTPTGIEGAGIAGARLDAIDFGRSVNSKHKRTLADNGVNTLYDAMKLGGADLENIKGIGTGVSSAIMAEIDNRLAT